MLSSLLFFLQEGLWVTANQRSEKPPHCLMLVYTCGWKVQTICKYPMENLQGKTVLYASTPKVSTRTEENKTQVEVESCSHVNIDKKLTEWNMSLTFFSLPQNYDSSTLRLLCLWDPWYLSPNLILTQFLISTNILIIPSLHWRFQHLTHSLPFPHLLLFACNIPLTLINKPIITDMSDAPWISVRDKWQKHIQNVGMLIDIFENYSITFLCY